MIATPSTTLPTITPEPATAAAKYAPASVARPSRRCWPARAKPTMVSAIAPMNTSPAASETQTTCSSAPPSMTSAAITPSASAAPSCRRLQARGGAAQPPRAKPRQSRDEGDGDQDRPGRAAAEDLGDRVDDGAG